MRLLHLFLLSLLLMCGEARAQQTDGYAFFAAGGIFAHGIGAGAEIGAMGTSFTHSVFGLFSANGYYHVLPHRKIDPFATAGYSLAFGLSAGNLFNYGFGANYWFRRSLGLKAEFRDYLWPTEFANRNYWGFRVGLAFRSE
jgi:hypothetical protein